MQGSTLIPQPDNTEGAISQELLYSQEETLFSSEYICLYILYCQSLLSVIGGHRVPEFGKHYG
jgi:hypothetical protein